MHEQNWQDYIMFHPARETRVIRWLVFVRNDPLRRRKACPQGGEAGLALETKKVRH